MDADARADLRFKGSLGPVDDLDELEVDDLRAGAGALGVFSERHGLSREDALEGLLDTVDALLEKGRHRVEPRGAHVLFGEGYRVVVSSDLECVVAYSTVHKERTLAQVRDGVRSRMRDSKVGMSGLLERLDDDTLDRLATPAQVVDAAIGPDASDAQRRDFRLRVRDAVAEVLDELEGASHDEVMTSTAYVRSPSGRHVMAADGLVVVLRADGLRVLDAFEGDSAREYDDPAPARKPRHVRKPARAGADAGMERAAS